MNYSEKNNCILITNQKDFNIEQTLECGQCFRFERLAPLSYKIIALNRILYITQSKEGIFLSPCTMKEFETLWYNYFDLGRDYSIIKEELSKDPVLKTAIDFSKGIRILNQQPFECLISFIISQNNRIPMIKKVIESISRKWGRQTDGGYLFPTVSALSFATEAELMECKTGFRYKYIRDCMDKISNGTIDLEKTARLSTAEAKAELMKIKGVGTKVADCVLLFSMEKTDAFPTDVWVKRVMEYFYFNKQNTPVKEIHTFAAQKWGRYAGFAQQYLFYYARTQQIKT